MFTITQARAAIAVNPFRRAEELESIIDRAIEVNCCRENQDAAWPLSITPELTASPGRGFSDVIEQVVARFTAAGWSMEIQATDDGARISVQRPT